jgi:hypothetical protein
LDIEQILHFCILRAFTGIWHAEHFCKITRLNPEMSGNVRNVNNSKLCYIEHCLYVTEIATFFNVICCDVECFPFITGKKIPDIRKKWLDW